MSTLLARLASFWRRVALIGVVIGFGLDLSGPVAWAQGLVLQPNPTSAAVNQAVTLHVEAWSSGNRPCGETCNAWPVAVVVTLAGSNGYENELVLELSDPWGNPWQALVANPTDVANTNGQDTDYGATGAVLWYECNYYCQYFGYPPEPWWEPLGEVGATVTAVLPNVPASVSVSPASGSGARQVFAFTYSDDAGANKIAQTWQIFHPSGQTSQSCVVGVYAPNYLVLWGDQGWQDQTSATLGSTAVLQNSQCRLHMSNVGVTESGNTLTVSLDVSFKSSYAGSKAITMYGYDVWGRYATPANMGAWTVPVHTLTAGPVTPVNGTGMSATLTGAFASTYGVADIQRTQLILWPASGGFAQACQVAFDRPSQQVGLLDDTGTTETWAAFGSSTVLQNSRCAVAAALVTTAEPSGTTWQVTATLAFTPAFGGTHTLYAVTYDPAWQTSQWQGQGTWTVAPTITSVTPTSGRVGDLVDVVGAGFGATAGTVRINGQTATIANWSDTYIRLAVPNTTSGNLVVTRESLDTAPVAFTVLPGPRITSLVPTWGPAGTEVTVSGHDFGSSGTLTLNGATMTVDPGDWDDDTITFVVPSGVQTGAVIVTNGSASNGVPFVVGDEGEEYVLTDAIGSIRMVTGHGGYVLARHDYQPFGIEVLPANGLARDGFGGKELDTETGAPSSAWAALNYFGARHLHAPSGRFTTVDPGHVGGHVSLPQSWNGYGYAGNNPLRFVDPEGTDYRVKEDAGIVHFVPGNFKALQEWATSMGFILKPGSHPAVAGSIECWGGETATCGTYLETDPRVLEMAKRVAPIQPFVETLTILALSVVSPLKSPTGGSLGVLGATGTKLLPAITATTEQAALKYGLKLSEHALKRLLERESHVSLRAVAKAIERGRKFYDPKNDSVVYVLEQGMASGESLLVGTNPLSGKVTTVLTGTKLIRPRMRPLP